MAQFQYLPYQNALIDRMDTLMFNWGKDKKKPFIIHFLKDYLVQNKAWVAFCNNFRTVPKRAGFADMFEYFLKTYDITLIIEFGFMWGKTNEGIQYWDALNNGWQKFLDDRENEGFDLLATCYNPSAIRKGVPPMGTQSQSQMGNTLAQFIGCFGALQNLFTPKTYKIDFVVPTTSSTITNITIKKHRGRPRKTEVDESRRYSQSD